MCLMHDLSQTRLAKQNVVPADKIAEVVQPVPHLADQIVVPVPQM